MSDIKIVDRLAISDNRDKIIVLEIPGIIAARNLMATDCGR
jgi:hypothetical protein